MNRGNHQQLIQFIEEKLGQGKSQGWTNGNFEKLSAEVRRETKVYISTATLKRIFGKVKVSEGYTPHRSTIEALEQFVDFEARIQTEDTERQLQVKYLRVAMIGIASLLAVGLALAGLEGGGSHPTSNIVGGNLVITKVEGKCPSTAFFDLRLDSLPGYHLWFGDESPLMNLPVKKRHHLTHFYAYPGYFTPELKYHGKTIAREDQVLVETDGWQAFAYLFETEELNKRYYPLLLSHNISAEGVFHVTKPSLANIGLDTTQILVVRLDNYGPTGVSADTMVYEARLKNDEFWPGVRCYSMIVRIQGTKGKIECKLVAEGCSGYSRIILGDSLVSDKLALLPLAVDVSDWNDLEISNEQGQVSLTLNGHLFYTGTYAGTLGELIGTSTIFHGSGKVDHISLKAHDQEVLTTPF